MSKQDKTHVRVSGCGLPCIFDVFNPAFSEHVYWVIKILKHLNDIVLKGVIEIIIIIKHLYSAINP